MISELPVIILKECFKIKDVLWFNQITIGIIVGILVVTLLYKPYKCFFTYVLFIVILKFLIIIKKMLFIKVVNGEQTFINSMISMQVPRIVIALIIIGFLYFIKKSRHEFYLRKGDISATAKPSKLLIERETSWKQTGTRVGVIICGVTLVFLMISGAPSKEQLVNVLPMIPFIIIFALMNSFSENVIYRISVISILKDTVGEKHALYLTTFVFGMGHYYGAPYGVMGVLMASYLGWFLGKSIIETKGIFWAWSIHFMQDVLIMTFLAFGSLMLGGT